LGAASSTGPACSARAPSPLDEHDRIAVERAVGLIALALLRDREDERVAGRERRNLLVSFLDGTFGDDAAARTRAAAMGFKPRGRMFALVVAPSRAHHSPTVGRRDVAAWTGRLLSRCRPVEAPVA
jgi:PucR family transcriptional regulator, purine catabolism regulatory protein